MSFSLKLRKSALKCKYGNLRLYIALYSLPNKPYIDHWALHLSRQITESRPIPAYMKYTCKRVYPEASVGQNESRWVFEATKIDKQDDETLFVRVLVCEVDFPDQVEASLCKVQEPPADDSYHRYWVRDGLAQLEDDGVLGVGGRRADAAQWLTMQYDVHSYVNAKRAQGRFDKGWEGGSQVPTFDLLQKKEIVA